MSFGKDSKDVIASTLEGARKTAAEFEAKFATMGREARAALETYLQAQVAREQEAEQEKYKLEMERRAVLDRQKEEDRERERAFADKQSKLSEIERTLKDVANKVFGVSLDRINDFDAIKSLLDKKIDDVRKEGIGIGTNNAKKEYEVEMKVKATEVATKLALLENDVERLKGENAALKSANAELTARNAELTTQTLSLVKDGFIAASAMNTQAKETIQSAVQASAARPR